MADNLSSLPVLTKNPGDVSVQIDQGTPGVTNGVAINAPLPAGTNIVGKFGIDQSTPGNTNGVQITGPGTNLGNTLYTQVLGTYNSSAPTLTTGSTSALQLDVNGNLKVIIGGGTGSTIGNVGLNAGTNIVGKVGIDQTTPGVSNGVQLATGGPGTSSTNPIYVNTGANISGTTKNTFALSSSSIGANGGTATIAASAITNGKVASLERATFSSASPMRYDLQYIPNGGGSPITAYTFFTTGAFLTIDFKAEYPTEFTLPSADGINQKYQVLCTSQDPQNANQAYATFVWLEV